MRPVAKRFAALVAVGGALAALGETLIVNVDTEGPREGVIAILVFKEKKGFPDGHEHSFRKDRFPVTPEGAISCSITNLPRGVYAVSVLHDVNDNYKCDKLLGFGPPKEPVGVSNHEGRLRKNPKFKDALITFGAESNTIAIATLFPLK